MSGYIRTDMSTFCDDECFLLPTISINKYDKGFEITLRILWFVAYAAISYIKENEYEP